MHGRRHSRLGRWTESLRHWHDLFDAEPSAFHASQVGCCSAMTGDFAQGQAWIARARARNADAGEMPDPQIVTSYISALTQAGQPARAMPYLEEIRALYTGLGVTDPTLLFVRRIPLFGIFFAEQPAHRARRAGRRRGPRLVRRHAGPPGPGRTGRAGILARRQFCLDDIEHDSASLR